MCLCSSSSWDAVMENSYQLMFAFFPSALSVHHFDPMPFSILPICTPRNCFLITEKENAPKTVNDVKLINGGKILENNQTLGECKSPICDLSGGITTMHVVVRPPSEKGTGKYHLHPSNHIASFPPIYNKLNLGSYMQLCILNFFSLMVL